MEKDEAYKTFKKTSDTSMADIHKIYLQKSEYYIKQLEDLEKFPHLVKEQDRFFTAFETLKDAYTSLGGIIKKDKVRPSKPIRQEVNETLISFETRINKLRDNFLDGLKKIPGLLFFTLIILLLFWFVLTLTH